MAGVDIHALKRSLESYGEYPWLALSFTLYKVLTFSVAFVTLPAIPVLPAFAGSSTPMVALLAAISTACVAFAVVGRDRHVFDKPRYLEGMAILFLSGMVLLNLVVPRLSGVGGLGTYACALVLMACGFCGVHIEFGRIMGYLGMTYTLIFNCLSLLIALPVSALLLILPPPGLLAAGVVGSVACTASLNHAVDQVGRAKVHRTVEAPLSIPWRFMATSCAQGVSAGLLFTVFWAQGTPPLGVTGQAAASVLAVLMAFTCGLALRIDFDRMIYRVGFASIGVGCMLYAIAGTSVVLPTASRFMQLFAFVYLDLILWSLGSYLIKDCGQPAIWVAACPSASLLAGRCTGSIVGSALTGPLGAMGTLFTTDVVAATASVASLVITLLALALTSRDNIRTGWGFITLAPEEEQPTDRMRACSLIGEDFRLTGREREVLGLMAEGKTRREITEELFVTGNTVKTHQHNIYAKLDIHSREELLRFIDHQRGAFSSHGE